MPTVGAQLKLSRSKIRFVRSFLNGGEVLGYSTLNEAIIDYVIRRIPSIALEHRAVEGIGDIISTLAFPDEAPLDVVIDEVLFKIAKE
uniref:Uncharacterized protein n=1 Tax=Ignisphaera aggregans TaxID=334771 RepID=A0A7J3Z7K6_9CREN